MKRLLTLLLITAIITSGVVSPIDIYAANLTESSKANLDGNKIINHEEKFVDEVGNIITLEVISIDDEIYSTVYVNDELTQTALIDFANNKITFTNLKKSTNYHNRQIISGVYKCTDFMQETVLEKKKNNSSEFSIKSFDTSGWSYYAYYPATPSYFGSKPCTLYFYNYDENPYDNPYLAKNISAGIGTPVSIVVGLMAAFLTGGITFQAIIATFGSAVIADVITNSISGTICYSTQKIRYAPVISGVNIFNDAYITKRFVITYDKLNGGRSYFLDRESYEFNRGERPDLIALNAQICEVSN